MRDLQYMIDVMTAARDGKKIQTRNVDKAIQGPWFTIPSEQDPDWQWGTQEYRIAPEPRKAREWTLFQKHGHLEVCDVPLKDCVLCQQVNHVVVREVLPDDES